MSNKEVRDGSDLFTPDYGYNIYQVFKFIHSRALCLQEKRVLHYLLGLELEKEELHQKDYNDAVNWIEEDSKVVRIPDGSNPNNPWEATMKDYQDVIMMEPFKFSIEEKL